MPGSDCSGWVSIMPKRYAVLAALKGHLGDFCMLRTSGRLCSAGWAARGDGVGVATGEDKTSHDTPTSGVFLKVYRGCRV